MNDDLAAVESLYLSTSQASPKPKDRSARQQNKSRQSADEIDI